MDVVVDDEDKPMVVVIVEVCMHASSGLDVDSVQNGVLGWLRSNMPFLRDGLVDIDDQSPLAQHIKTMRICLPSSSSSSSTATATTTAATTAGKGEGNNNIMLPLWRAQPRVCVYRLNEDGAAAETTTDDDDDDDGGGSSTTACMQWVLPAREFEDMWETLYFDRSVKDDLLSFISTAMLFSDAHVNPHIISCNRVVLLHGPPGTGKTSLCKSLAHKLAIRFGERYRHGQLLEINAHSLFSKWFSESGKLVMKLFDRIQELVEDRDSFVCVLIDEVESLTAARQAAVSGSEPSDAIRVVNALLTQLDKLKQYDNVLILTTSNVTDALDLAFVDRADIKAFIGLPNVHARYEILRSCLLELLRVGIIVVDANANTGGSGDHDGTATHHDALLPPYGVAVAISSSSSSSSHCRLLVEVAVMCDGLSGRFLRKLPFTAHAYFIGAREATLPLYLQTMRMAVEREMRERDAMSNNNNNNNSGGGGGGGGKQ